MYQYEVDAPGSRFRKAARVTGILLVVFILCWLPFNINVLALDLLAQVDFQKASEYS